MKRLYLTLAPGRCGTAKLAQILSSVPDMYAEHDADGPDSCCWVRQAPIEVQKQYIQRRIAFYETLPQSNIANTTHMVGEGFVEHYIEAGMIPNFIILRRDPREVALSMWRLDWIPGRNKTYSPWYLGPDEKDVLPYTNWQTAHNYQLCYWWCCDTERRIQKYAPLGSKVWTTSLPQILDINHFNSMLDFFNLQNIPSISQEKVNDFDWNFEQTVRKDWPPNEYLNTLEQEVLNSIPVDFKEHLQVVWKDYVANRRYERL